MVFPSIWKAAFIVGAEGGNGILLARDKDGTWSDPAFYTIPESRDLVAQYLLVYEMSGGEQAEEFVKHRNIDFGSPAASAR